jgi:hypothetical protein
VPSLSLHVPVPTIAKTIDVASNNGEGKSIGYGANSSTSAGGRDGGVVTADEDCDSVSTSGSDVAESNNKTSLGPFLPSKTDILLKHFEDLLLLVAINASVGC